MKTNSFNLWFKKVTGENIKKYISFLLFPFRNLFILYNVGCKSNNNRVNLNYWFESHNLGDTLSPVIVNYMLSLKGILPDVEVQGRKHLYAIGSILTAGIQDASVWGSGILNTRLTWRLSGRKFDFRAVRGPLTRIELLDYDYKVPEVFGDPAILLPEIYLPKNNSKRYKYALIMHKDKNQCIEKRDDMLVIDIKTNDYKSFIDDITSVDVVISSSLHGIIIAESYGISAILLNPPSEILKYYDWYYSTKRYNVQIAENIESALKMQPLPLPSNLDDLRKGLKDSFPYDLYSD